MSNGDGDNEEGGWFDEWRDSWNNEPQYEFYINPDAPEGWDTWKGHNDEDYSADQGGSHWHWESEHWESREEAVLHGLDSVENPSDYIDGGVGNIAEWHVTYDAEDDSWYLEFDAYVEY